MSSPLVLRRSSLRHNSTANPITGPQAREIRSLVRVLVRKVKGSFPNGNGSGDGQPCNLLLNEEIEGVRCLLILPRQAPKLSPREQEIAQMIAMGHPNKMIALKLKIRPDTVGSHLRRVYAKLGVAARGEMIWRLSEAWLLFDRVAWLQLRELSDSKKPQEPER